MFEDQSMRARLVEPQEHCPRGRAAVGCADGSLFFDHTSGLTSVTELPKESRRRLVAKVHRKQIVRRSFEERARVGISESPHISPRVRDQGPGGQGEL